MSLITDIEQDGTSLETFLKSVVKGTSTLRIVFSVLSGPGLACSLALLQDALRISLAASEVVTDAQSGNVVGTITLSEQTVELVQKLVSDFKAGEKSVVEDFNTLGINTSAKS